MDLDKFESEIKLPKKFTLIFPGAADEKRRWNSLGFLQVADYLSNELHFPVVIAGSEREVEIGKIIFEKLNSELIIDLTSKTTLSQLAKIISDTKLLISNDTGAVHIAAAVNTEFLCISNGNHFGRFTPYPDNIFNKAHYIYPPEIINHLDDKNLLEEKYRFNSDLDINSITGEEVKNKIKELI